MFTRWGLGPFAQKKKQLVAEGKLDKHGRPNENTPKEYLRALEAPAGEATPAAAKPEAMEEGTPAAEETPKKKKKKKAEDGEAAEDGEKSEKKKKKKKEREEEGGSEGEDKPKKKKKKKGEE